MLPPSTPMGAGSGADKVMGDNGGPVPAKSSLVLFNGAGIGPMFA